MRRTGTRSATEQAPDVARSRSVFLALQIGAVVAGTVLFGGPLLYAGYVAKLLSGELVIGGVAVLVGTSFLARGAPRIYDPSAEMTLSEVSRGYEHHDGEVVHVEKVTGSRRVRYSREGAIRGTLTGLALCIGGMLVGLLVRL